LRGGVERAALASMNALRALSERLTSVDLCAGGHVRRGSPGRRSAIVVYGLLAFGAAATELPLLPDPVERLDLVTIERDGRDLYAFDAVGGGRRAVRIEVGEELIFEESEGRVGLVLTNRRALGVAAGGGWVELRFGAQETLPEGAVLGDRQAVFVSNRRAVGFLDDGNWVEERLAPNEAPRLVRAGTIVALVATDRRALGLAPAQRRFVEVALSPREEIESVSVQDALITLRTPRRILAFSALQGRWTVERRAVNAEGARPWLSAPDPMGSDPAESGTRVHILETERSPA
jgi:hypothetical protein